MEKLTDYEQWAQGLDERIRTEPGPEATGGKEGGDSHPKRLLLKFVNEAGMIAGAIGRNIDAVNIQDRNRYQMMGDFLDKMLQFEEFSMVEYRYSIPSKREPGVRFKVTTRDGKRIIVAVYFHDLVFWQVDPKGERVSMELCEFEVAGDSIKARPNPALSQEYKGCVNWRDALRETMALPFRHLYERGWGGVNPALFLL